MHKINVQGILILSYKEKELDLQNLHLFKKRNIHMTQLQAKEPPPSL
jgi:hypothetical protein